MREGTVAHIGYSQNSPHVAQCSPMIKLPLQPSTVQIRALLQISQQKKKDRLSLQILQGQLSIRSAVPHTQCRDSASPKFECNFQELKIGNAHKIVWPGEGTDKQVKFRCPRAAIYSNFWRR